MARRPRLQRSMQAFTSVQKPLDVSVNKKKRKQDVEYLDELESSVVSIDTKRRKVEVVITQTTTQTSIKQQSLKKSTAKTLGAKRKRSSTPDSAIDVSTLPSSPLADTEENLFEDELQDLQRLCTAFLSALSVHYAHGGSSTTVDLRYLLPSITKAWGVRKVELVDVRRVIGMMQSSKSRQLSFANTFGMKDYGAGKVCIELKTTASTRSRTGRFIDEVSLKTKFKDSLDSIWRVWYQDSKKDSSLGYASFLDRLPLEPLPVSSTNRKIAAITSKGQRRLEEVLIPFKRININDDADDRPPKRSRKDMKSPFDVQKREVSVGIENTPPTTPQKPMDRAQSLLDRIKAKEALAKTLPAGPTKEERERLAALQRAEEMLQILNLLAVAKGGSRVSFPLPTLISNIQSSVRSPLSREEILRCIKVLQMEVAPGHVSLVTFGSITGVVIDISRKPAAADVLAKLQAFGL